MRSDDALATILVVSRLADEGTQPLKASEYWRLLDHIGDPGALLGPTAPQLIGALDADLADRVTRLLDRATSIAFELERLDQSGIATLTPFDADYPRRWVDRLGPGAPPVMHAAGPLALLQQTAVGILGHADAEDVARDLATEAVRLGAVVVTADAGFDAGAGTNTVAVLADPLLRTVRHPEIRRAVIAGTRLLCTPYAPDARATAAARTGRFAKMGQTTLVSPQSLFVVSQPPTTVER